MGLGCCGLRGLIPREPTWDPGRNAKTYKGDPLGSFQWRVNSDLRWEMYCGKEFCNPKIWLFFLMRINHVIADLIKRIYSLKSQAEHGETVANFNDLLVNYSIEGVAFILDISLGYLRSHISQSWALELMISMLKAQSLCRRSAP